TKQERDARNCDIFANRLLSMACVRPIALKMKATTLNVLDPQPFLRIAINPRYFETNPSEFARVGDTDRGQLGRDARARRTGWPWAVDLHDTMGIPLVAEAG